MPSMKAIKQRRASVKNMQQAMRAMNLVATAKLQRARQEWDNNQPFVTETDAMMLTAAADPSVSDHYFVKRRGTGKNAAYLVISSDRGKCGGYNINVAKAALTHARDNDKNPLIYVVGMRGLEYFLTRNQSILQYTPSPTGTPSYEQAQHISKDLMKLYGDVQSQMAGEVDELYIVFTRFHSILSTEPVVVPLFPLVNRLHSRESGRKSESKIQTQMEYEPGADDFLTYMSSIYLTTYIYGAMMESVVCEQAARMLNMDAATNNATDIIDDLTLLFNRQRQSVITQEITEIVSGANALQ